MPLFRCGTEGDKACHLLTKVDDQFILGRADDLPGAQRMLDAHRQAQAFHHALITQLRIQLHRIFLIACRRQIQHFAVINIGKTHGRLPAMPGIIRGNDHLARSRLHAQFAQKRQRIAVNLFLLSKAKAAFIPAVAQHDRQLIFLRQQGGHIIGLILQPVIIIIAIRRKVFIPHALAIQIRLVQAQAHDIQPCRKRIGRQREMLEQPGIFHLFCRCDPLALPGFFHLARFKMCARRQRRFAVIRRDAHIPAVLCARLQRYFRHKAQAVHIAAITGIIYRFLALIHPDAG